MLMQKGFWIYSCFRPPGPLCPSVAPSLVLSLVIRPFVPESTVSLCHESRSQMSAACVRVECHWAGQPRDLNLSLLLFYLLHWQILLWLLSPQSWCPGSGWRALSQGCYFVSGPGPPLPRSGAVSGWVEPRGGNKSQSPLLGKYRFPLNMNYWHDCGSDCTSLWALCGSPHKTRSGVTNKDRVFFTYFTAFSI